MSSNIYHTVTIVGPGVVTTPGSYTYDSPLIIGSGVTVEPPVTTKSQNGYTGVYSSTAGVSLTNDGTIMGGPNSQYYGPGMGVDLTNSATFTNNGHVYGGIGELGTGAYLGAVGVVGMTVVNNTQGVIQGSNLTGMGAFGYAGMGVEMSGGGTFKNFGTVAGGNGTLDGAVGNGGVGMSPAGNVHDPGDKPLVTNYGSIEGGAGYTKGGDGVTLGGQVYLLNEASGVIRGGTSSRGGVLGFGGYGVGGGDLYGGVSATNHGRIYGGGGNNGGTGGAGVQIIDGCVFTNTNYIDGGGNTVKGGGTTAQGGAGARVLPGGTLSNSGTIVGGLGSSSDGVGVYIGDGSFIDSGTVKSASGVAVMFRGDTFPYGGVLVTEAGASLDGTIGNFSYGDTVIVKNGYYTGFNNGTDSLKTASDGTLTFDPPPSKYHFVFAQSVYGPGTTEITLSAASCYLRGTHIRTARGEVPIETLRIGDPVSTMSGAERPIRWIGRRSYSRLFAAGNREVLPVRIRAGALGPDIPKRDLWVSPEHAMWVDGLLIPARALINGESILQQETAEDITYLHLEFDIHAVIFAEGAPSESFVDDDSRHLFDNAAEYAALYPEARRQPARFCAPRVEEGEELERIRRSLAVSVDLGRAKPSGSAPSISYSR